MSTLRRLPERHRRGHWHALAWSPLRSARCALVLAAALCISQVSRSVYSEVRAGTAYVGRGLLVKSSRTHRLIRRHQAVQEADVKPGSKSSRTDGYKRLTQREHVLQRPDMYIGPLEPRNETVWVLKRTRAGNGSSQMLEQTLLLSPGLVQIYNEILVNAVDRQYQGISGREMSEIRIDVDAKKGDITIWNDGGAIPIEMHDSGMYVPSLVFGEFLSGNNFDDSKIRFTGGRNGVGAKATNVFSKEFEVRVDDPSTGKRFQQLWKDNMKTQLDPEISSLPSEVTRGSVMVRFRPDVRRFGLTNIDAHHRRFLLSRAWDAAACTRQNITVSFDGEPLQVQSFQEYSEQVLGPNVAMCDVRDDTGRLRAEISVAFAGDDGFRALGFVNGIRCSRGTHIKHVTDQLASAIADLAGQSMKKKPSGATVKQYIRLVVNVLVDNPGFDSQTKTKLTTTSSKLGFDLVLPSEFAQQVADLGVLDAAIRAMMASQRRVMRESLSVGVAPSLAKLEDAAHAGKPGHNCTLIVTEGDSAKALAIAGLAKLGRQHYGVFPLKGKPLNVRTATQKQLQSNDEIKHLMQIIGLKWGQEFNTWEDTEALRYQQLMIFSDQDLDGHHIAGLLINFIAALWPSLLEVHPRFLQRFATPVVKVFPKSKTSSSTAEHAFFTQGDFNTWQEKQGDGWNSRYRAKYYKGLGTSTRQEAMEYFSDTAKHVLDLVRTGPADDESILLAFEKDKAEDRKEWLQEYDSEKELDYSLPEASYRDFMDKQYIHFSTYDNVRSIPRLLDGLKPSQRKVIYWARQHLRGEKKVSQIMGLVSSATSYHHGEASLEKVIVSMAQNFIGTNNLNLLEPIGMFGTRLNGRDVHASARYIHTAMSPLSRFIFRKEDDDVLERQFEDGQLIEPKSLLPIFPLVLVNGFLGIGTGWACECPNYDPLEVVNALEKWIDGKPISPRLKPSYKGFQGNISVSNGKYYSSGKWHIYSSKGKKGPPDTVEITELPIGIWTDDFIAMVEEKAKRLRIMSAIHKCDDHDDERIHLLIGFDADELRQQLVQRNPRNSTDALQDAIVKHLGLEKSMPSNMWLFDSDVDEEGQLLKAELKKFDSPEGVIKAFERSRRPFYERRKAKQLQKAAHKAELTKNQLRCIQMVRNRTLAPEDLTACSLEAAGFQPMRRLAQSNSAEDADDETGQEDFEYILRMPLGAFSDQKAQALERNMLDAEKELRDLKHMSINDMWKDELRQFREEYVKIKKRERAPLKPELQPQERKDIERAFSQERKRRGRLANEQEGIESATWLEKQKKEQLRELCKYYGIAPQKSKQDFVNVLLLYGSMAFSSPDWNKLSVVDLAKHLKARGISQAGTRPELLNRISKAPVPEVPMSLTASQMKMELKEYGLKYSGKPAEELRQDIRKVRLRRAQAEKDLRQLSLDELADFASEKEEKVGGTRAQLIERLATVLVTACSEDIGLIPPRKKQGLNDRLLLWIRCCGEARKVLNIAGFEPVKKDTPLYKEARKCYEKELNKVARSGQ
eukprot:TRINITY_DN29237_c0_g2_i1.p1 TRINITY_DN29237_c0_g2~~TRINITY_DN29237_c0_g2_i1.p1  ORF type:complete len:1522 (-),score=282.44 TRINITY_DN29237_c0_g2_i1:17-4582(-)